MDLGRAQNNVRSRAMSCQKGMSIWVSPSPYARNRSREVLGGVPLYVFTPPLLSALQGGPGQSDRMTGP